MESRGKDSRVYRESYLERCRKFRVGIVQKGDSSILQQFFTSKVQNKMQQTTTPGVEY
jgi:hypothetical protein